ncbi:hypothetical protein GCM10009609_74880 [Pseudonocardia aurantiaca]
MADPGSGAGSETDSGSGSGVRSAAGMPRWVKVSGIVALAVALALVVVLLTGAGGHGPGRHMPSGVTSGVPSTVTEHGEHP